MLAQRQRAAGARPPLHPPTSQPAGATSPQHATARNGASSDPPPRPTSFIPIPGASRSYDAGVRRAERWVRQHASPCAAETCKNALSSLGSPPSDFETPFHSPLGSPRPSEASSALERTASAQACPDLPPLPAPPPAESGYSTEIEQFLKEVAHEREALPSAALSRRHSAISAQGSSGSLATHSRCAVAGSQPHNALPAQHSVPRACAWSPPPEQQWEWHAPPAPLPRPPPPAQPPALQAASAPPCQCAPPPMQRRASCDVHLMPGARLLATAPPQWPQALRQRSFMSCQLPAAPQTHRCRADTPLSPLRFPHPPSHGPPHDATQPPPRAPLRSCSGLCAPPPCAAALQHSTRRPLHPPRGGQRSHSIDAPPPPPPLPPPLPTPCYARTAISSPGISPVPSAMLPHMHARTRPSTPSASTHGESPRYPAAPPRPPPPPPAAPPRPPESDLVRFLAEVEQLFPAVAPPRPAPCDASVHSSASDAPHAPLCASSASSPSARTYAAVPRSPFAHEPPSASRRASLADGAAATAAPATPPAPAATTLGDVWAAFTEASTFGLAVPTLSSPQGPSLAYFTPFLSAVQITVVGEGGGKPRAPTLHSLGLHNGDSELAETNSGAASQCECRESDSLEAPTPRRLDASDCSVFEGGACFLQSDACSTVRGESVLHEFSPGSDRAASGEPPAALPAVWRDALRGKAAAAPQQHLVANWACAGHAWDRAPLAQHIEELAAAPPDPGSHTLPRPAALRSLPLAAVHSSSWFAVLWHPLYRIPDAELHARFITYHSFGDIAAACGNTRAEPAVRLAGCLMDVGESRAAWTDNAVAAPDGGVMRWACSMDRELADLRAGADALSRSALYSPNADGALVAQPLDHADYRLCVQ